MGPTSILSSGQFKCTVKEEEEETSLIAPIVPEYEISGTLLLKMKQHKPEVLYIKIKETTYL